jgi:hypothetical protein
VGTVESTVAGLASGMLPTMYIPSCHLSS